MHISNIMLCIHFIEIDFNFFAPILIIVFVQIIESDTARGLIVMGQEIDPMALWQHGQMPEGSGTHQSINYSLATVTKRCVNEQTIVEDKLHTVTTQRRENTSIKQ